MQHSLGFFLVVLPPGVSCENFYRRNTDTCRPNSPVTSYYSCNCIILLWTARRTNAFDKFKKEKT